MKQNKLFSLQLLMGFYVINYKTMPLIKSTTREALKANIKELISSGRTRDQAVKIALENKRKLQSKK